MADSSVDVGNGGSEKLRKLGAVHGAQILVQVVFGGNFVLNKFALNAGVQPVVFAFYATSVCLAILGPIAFFLERRKRTPITIPILALLFISGFFGPYGFQILVLYGVALTSASFTSAIAILVPLLTFIISTSLGFEHVRWKKHSGQLKAVGLVSSVAGAAVLAMYFGPVVLGPADSEGEIHARLDPLEVLGDASGYLRMTSWQLGIALLFLAGFALSVNVSIQVPILKRYPAPISASAITAFFGVLLLGLTALVTDRDRESWVITDFAPVIAFMYMGCFVGAFSTTVIIWSVHKAGPILAAAYTPLQLFSASAFAYIFLQESIHLGSVIGILLIITGLGFITWGKIKTQDGFKKSDSLPVSTPVGIPNALAAPLLA